MARRTDDQSGVRKLIKLGEGSLAVTIPVAIIRRLGWQEKQLVLVQLKDGAVVVTDKRN